MSANVFMSRAFTWGMLGLAAQGFADLAVRFAGVRGAGAGAEALSASTVVTKRIP